MLRLTLLSLFAFVSAASAQTADVLSGPGETVRGGPVTYVTYDLSKLVKANPDLNSADKVLARLTEIDLIRPAAGKGDPGDPTLILAKNRIIVSAHATVHDEIRKALDWWQKPVEKKAVFLANLPLVQFQPAAALPPPWGLRADIRDALLNPPKKTGKK